MLLYSLRVPHQGASNEYPLHTFLRRNKKNIDIFWLRKVPYLEVCIHPLQGDNATLWSAGSLTVKPDKMSSRKQVVRLELPC